ncbi:MAG TPA: transposase [Anaerolineales bacterium]|nr:transposase [Anaerolineales bacterium]
MSIITYQFRIKDSTSANQLTRMASAVNRVWNYANEISMFALRRDHRWLSAYAIESLTAGTSKVLGIHSDTINLVCQEYATRRQQFKKPRLAWRSKKRSLGWIPFKGRCIRVRDDSITYCGYTFRFWLSRTIVGTIKSGSFTQDARGRWYVNLQCEVSDEAQQSLGLDAIGIDLGLKNQVTCSDGETYSRENLTRQYADELAMAQRARKKKRTKAIHAKLKNRRKDWTHKVTTKIARRANFIVVGNVSSSKLAKTRMAKSVYDAGWSTVRACLKYKAIRLGAQYREQNESFSTVTCSDCLSRSGPSGLSRLGVREWTCSNCGVIHDRDINAAHNILRMGRHTPIKGIIRL